MIEVKPPEPTIRLNTPGPRVFLAGSIENGKAEQWQRELVRVLADYPGVVFNPRRDDWDPNASDPQVCEQIRWEQHALDVSDIIVFYFDPETMSPITLLELGQVLGLGGVGAEVQVLICCPLGYYRYHNVYQTVHMFERTNVQFTRSPLTLLSLLRDTVGRWA